MCIIFSVLIINYASYQIHFVNLFILNNSAFLASSQINTSIPWRCYGTVHA